MVAGCTLPHQGSPHPRPRSLSLLSVLLLIPIALTIGACGDSPSEPKVESPPEEPTEWTEWLLTNGNALSSLTSLDFSDLQFLKSTLGNRRIVQLGESGHGVAQFNQAKVRLIRFLHEQMDFDVIAFESGLYECFQAVRGTDSLTAVRFMYHCPFGVWHTHEVVPLFEYVKATQATEDPLILAGFDIQPSSWLGRQRRPQFMAEVVAAVDPGYADEVRSLEAHFDALLDEPESWTVTLAAHADTLRTRYVPVLEFFGTHEAELLSAFPGDPAVPLVARQMVWSVLELIKMAEAYGDGTCAGTNIRDKSMAANLTYLAETVYPTKKIMAWAHNAHIRHANQEIPDETCFTMGQDIALRHRSELYTVGLYMYQGNAAWNNRDVYLISPVSDAFLEGILHQAGEPYFFLDLLHQTSSGIPAWITGQIWARTWGYYNKRIVPRNQYDAILFVDQVNAPDYVN